MDDSRRVWHGRMQVLDEGQDFSVIVDSADTPQVSYSCMNEGYIPPFSSRQHPC
jgi:ureidoglycolate hydrolase